MADTNTKTLEMIFVTSGGKEVTVAVKDPKDGLTLADVQAVMAAIIAKNVFSSTSGDLVTAKEAQIRQLAINEIEVIYKEALQMEEMARLTATYGFPMVVAFYLLVRLEKRLTELTSAINQMCNCVERMEVMKK